MFCPAAFLVSCLLLCSGTRAAIEDFMVAPGEEQFKGSNELGLACQADDEEELISFHDVQHDGIVDTQLLLRALMQHAQRLGMSLDQLASQSQVIEAENALEAEGGCTASEALSYQPQPNWYDVFFN